MNANNWSNSYLHYNKDIKILYKLNNMYIDIMKSDQITQTYNAV